MPDYPNPNDPYILALLLALFVVLLLAGMFWVEDKLNERIERERQAVEDLRAHAGAEAYVHHDRCN